MNQPCRVIQWATGSIGQIAIRHFADNPAFELVGVLVTSPAKAGRDAGGAVLGQRHLAAETLEEDLQQLPVGGDVINHQHAQPRDRIGGRSVGPSAGHLPVLLLRFRQGVSLDRQIGGL